MAPTIEAAVTVDGRSSRPITLYYSTQNGTATAGADYTAIPMALSRGPLSITVPKAFSYTILDDETDESAEETFTLKLNSADNAQLGTEKFNSIVIQDDDPAPVISAKVSNNGEVDEDAEASHCLGGIDRPSTQTITRTYTTVNGTAVAGADYVAKTKTLTWNPGEEDPIVANIDITDDEIFESDETFIFRLESKSAVPPLAQPIQPLPLLTKTQRQSSPLTAYLRHLTTFRRQIQMSL